MAAGKGANKAGWFLKGPDPRRNTTTPGPGRPKDSFKAFLRSLRDHPVFRRRLRAIALRDPDADRFLRFAAWLLERSDGRPIQPIARVEEPGLDALKEMPNERFLAYVQQLEAEVAAARRAGPRARQG